MPEITCLYRTLDKHDVCFSIKSDTKEVVAFIEKIPNLTWLGETPDQAWYDLEKKYMIMTWKRTEEWGPLPGSARNPSPAYSIQMEAIIDAKNAVKAHTRDSREKSMVLTKLDEAYMWLKELETAGPKE